MFPFSVHATVRETCPLGQPILYKEICGHLNTVSKHHVPLCTAILEAVLSVPLSGISSDTVERARACMLSCAWTPSSGPADKAIDPRHTITDGSMTVLAGTLCYTHGDTRLPVPLPCVTVSHGNFYMHVHACPRDSRLPLDALFFEPFSFLYSDKQAVAKLVPVTRSHPTAMARHTSHRSKRIVAKTHHTQTLKRLCLHDDKMLSDLEVLPNGCIMCSTFFQPRQLTLVTCSVPSM